MNVQRANFTVQNFEAAAGVFVTRLAKDTSRRFLQIQNKGDYDVYINFGDDVATEANSLVIPPGSLYEPYICPVNEIKFSADSGAAGSSTVIAITDSSTTTVSK